ncbi:unnamed protein product [Timema podura]|uniref:MICOS complex subunit MIC13 n=1 Tax=Timema podura TaxID=61482 RepID=A0ABN7P806_TIMPD|nr:unnamed protein product [Timema podura]
MDVGLSGETRGDCTGFGAKAGLAGAAIYYTVKEGLWGDSERTEQLYKKLYSLSVPYIKEVPIEVPQIPKIGEISYEAQHYWNKGVKASFAFIRDLPVHVTNLTKTGAAKLSEQFQQLNSGKDTEEKIKEN